MEKLALKIGEEFWLKPQQGIGECKTLPSGDPCPQRAYSSVGNFISAILPNIYIIAGIILFVLLIIGGITTISGAGKGDQEAVKKGQKAITTALLGFLIIFASYWIIQLIEILTGVQIFQSGL